MIVFAIYRKEYSMLNFKKHEKIALELEKKNPLKLLHKTCCHVFSFILTTFFFLPIIILFVNLFMQFIFIPTAFVILSVLSVGCFHFYVCIAELFYYKMVCTKIGECTPYKSIFIVNFFDKIFVAIELIAIIIINIVYLTQI